MLWNIYPESLDNWTLESAQASLHGDPPSSIPWIVWLLENPRSPIALPGAIDLYGHDCMHLLLKQGFSPAQEAYVVGFTMGNSSHLNPLHLLIFCFVARYLYPDPYRMGKRELEIFNVGVRMGKSLQTRNLCQLNFQEWKHITLRQIRLTLGLESDREVFTVSSAHIS
jgi:hypothetical protein